MTAGRPRHVIEDATPLMGASIDVAARIGWMLRFARTCAASAVEPRLDRMAASVGTNAARLHRLETGQLRDARLVAAYERVLGFADGALRAPIDVLCRTFSRLAPPDRTPVEPSDVRTVSRLTEQLMSGRADGGAWLDWAGHLARPGAVGLPESWAAGLIDTLASEMGRAVGPAYPSRYEALALLRSGPYGGVVLDVARRRVADPDIQVLYDLISAVCERASDDVADWMLDLMDDEREHVAIAGVLGMERLAAVVDDPAEVWRGRDDHVRRIFGAADEGSLRWVWMSHALRLVPRELARGHGPLDRPLAPMVREATWTKSRLNASWSDCERRSQAIATELGFDEEPMIARLLFDQAVSPLETRGFTTYILMSGLGRIVAPFDEHIALIADEHDDLVVRDRAARRLAGSQHGTVSPGPRAWLRDAEPHLASGLRIVGSAGEVVAPELVRRAAAVSDDLRRAAMLAAGMSDPVTTSAIAKEVSADPRIRGAARWWEAEGGRVVDA